MPPAASFIILGTVQLGLPYGLGQAGQQGLDEAAATSVLDAATDSGIVWLDTARAYGASEQRIGRWLARRSPSIKLTSKLGKLQTVADSELSTAIRRDLVNSLSALGQPGLENLLTHNGQDILRPDVQSVLQTLVDEGVIRSYGASVYTPAEAAAALACPGLSHLQIPASLLNQSFFEHDLLKQAKQAGVTIHARSLYTQGLLFLDPDRLPAHLQLAAPVLRRLRSLAQSNNADLAALAIAALSQQAEIDGAVIGCDTPDQVRSAVSSLTSRQPPAALVEEALSICRGLPQAVVDPRLWPK